MSAPYPPPTHIICTGAVYIDTILSVPHFPPEDSKLRAQSLTRRRGGNTANTLQVLSQLVSHSPSPAPALHLVAVLPDRDSDAARFIQTSLPGVHLEQSIYRQGAGEAASSYVMKSRETLSRTIVSINPLLEMTLSEFQNRVLDIGLANAWIHFEGRVPDVILPCVQYLRSEHAHVRVSVECEKPEREGIQSVAALADVVFFSRLWAETKGFCDARTFLEVQVRDMREGAMLCCTWGAGGATIVQKDGRGGEWACVVAWKDKGGGGGEVVDTIGAGDTFIAGMLFAINRHHEWSLQRKLEFANELAGRKVLQEGFAHLGVKMW